MKILVTGGAGFIGSHIVEHFNGRAEITVIDNLRSGYYKNIESFDINFIEASVLDRKAVRSTMQGVDYVFHLAAMVSVPESMHNPVECVKINNEGTLTVLEEASEAGVKKLCFSSSAAIYGDNPKMPKEELMIPEPKSPYAVSKLDGEYYCDIFNRERKLSTACLRYFNVFGPRQDPGSAYAAAVPIFTFNAVKNEEINIFGDGEQTRDFIFVKDVIAANIFMATSEHTGTYNVAYGKKISINKLVDKIKRILNSKSEVFYKPERSGDVKHSLASVNKLRGLGFKPNSDFDIGLSETIKYFKKNQKGE